MAVSQKDTFEQMVHSVSTQLRLSCFGLKRLEAEWLCFRMISLIKIKYLEGHASFHVADSVHAAWNQLDLKREFDLLYSGVKNAFNPTTSEERTCLPNSNTYGRVSVPNGMKGKSRRNN